MQASDAGTCAEYVAKLCGAAGALACERWKRTPAAAGLLSVHPDDATANLCRVGLANPEALADAAEALRDAIALEMGPLDPRQDPCGAVLALACSEGDRDGCKRLTKIWKARTRGELAQSECTRMLEAPAERKRALAILLRAARIGAE